MTDEILDAAKAYCDQGLFIILVGKNKVPHTLHGLKDATHEYNEFLKLYHPGDQIAILTGQMNNLYVVDCDVEKDEKHMPLIKDGHVIETGEQNFLKQFINYDNAEKFRTRTIRTQSGGKQLYFKLKNGQGPLKTHLNILRKVDFKGDGGYVVASPSAGQYGKYEIIVDAPIAVMPDELYDYILELDMPDDSSEPIKPLKPDDSTQSLLIKTLTDIFKHTNGKGNEMLMAFSGAMALRNIPIEHTKEIIKEAAIMNQWPDVNYAVIDDSYKKVKNHQKVLGYTTFKNDLIANKDQYENFDEIIKNLELIFKHHESPFCDIDIDGHKKFNKAKSIAFVREKYADLFTDENDNIYYFSSKDGWHEDVEVEISSFIQNTDASLSEHNINEIIAGLKHLTYNKEFKSTKLPNTLIPIPAGLYNVEKRTLEPHNKNYFYTNIKRKYISNIKQQDLAFDDFLNKVLSNPEKDKLTVYESLTWCLLNDNNIQGMVIFYGQGGNGKGIIQNQVIANQLGIENVAMPDLNRIANYPFELQSLVNKRALLFSESIKGVTYNWEILKRITGHDFENVPIKNKAAILAQYQSAVILSTNSLIPPKDEIAIWRRIINIVEFNNYLTSLASSEIAKIVDELANPDELDKLFSFIVDNNLPKFLASGFSARYDLKTAKSKYLMKSNPAITYLNLKEARDEILRDPEDVLNYCRSHNYNQNKCYYIDKNGNETIFQIKKILLKQVNQFCEVNHLPKYDEQDRNSQTKLGQATHYLDIEVSDLRKSIGGKPIHAWAGIFVLPDDEDIKIVDDDGSNPDNPDPPKNSEEQGTSDPEKDNNNSEQEPETGDDKQDEKPGNEGTEDNLPGNSPDPSKEPPSNDKNGGEKKENENTMNTDKNISANSNSQILEIKNRILDIIKHGSPSNELSNIQRLINSDYGLDAESIANIIKSLISENAASLDSFKKHLMALNPKVLYYKTKDKEALNPKDALPVFDFTHEGWQHLKLELPEIPQTKSWMHFIAKAIEISEKEFEAIRGDNQ